MGADMLSRNVGKKFPTIRRATT